MPPGSARRRRRSSTLEEESSQAADSPKRPRLGSRAQNGDIDGPSSTDGATSSVDTDSFKPGAIVRVLVKNFVTYEKAEFFPGPNLNMVVGPNGTGKSSLVCAICLGLGYGPKHLGRAGSPKEFVKHGKDTATIEIELFKRPEDRRNHVVRVQIRKEQNTQKWWLNDKETSLKSIHSLMRKLKIQVDNLCQFLPQDRVVEFAASTPVDLLHETIRATAPEEMLTWQSQLRDLHKDRKEVAKASHNDREILKNLESRQQGLQADVDRIREREQIQEQITNLNSALVLSRYQEARDAYTKAKERKKEAERSLRRLEQESGPSLEAVNEKQLYAQQIDEALSGRKRASQDAETAVQKLAQDVNTISENIKQFEHDLEAENRGYEAKRKDLGASKSKLTSLQADLKNKPADFNAAEFNQRIRAEEHRQRELETEKLDLATKISNMKARGSQQRDLLRKLEADLASFDTKEGQQLNYMKKDYPDVATAWEWIREHQNEFEQEIFGPPMVTCSIKDERYVDHVQSLLQNDDFTCFTAQNIGDHTKLSNQLYKVMGLSVTIRTCLQQFEAFRHPMNPAETQECGLDGYAIDYLGGPKPVLAMLCIEKKLHLSGVALRDLSGERQERLVNDDKVMQWAAGRQTYTIRRRREYGASAMTVISRDFKPRRFWTSQPVDTQEKANLQTRLNEIRSERDELKQEYRALQEQDTKIEEQIQQCYDQIQTIKKEKNVLQMEFQKWQSIPDKIDSEQKIKEMREQAIRDARQNMIDLRYNWDAAVVQRAKLVLKHKKAIDRLREAHQEILEAHIRLIEANSDIDGLKARNSSIMEQLEAEKTNVREAAAESSRCRDAGISIAAEVSEVLAKFPDSRELLNDLSQGKTPDEIRDEIQGEEAKLELIHTTNPGVMADFQQRADRIANLSKKLESANSKLDGLSAQIDELMGRWVPKLEELVSKISDAFAYNFEQISCAGEVRIHKDEDFDNWALDIMVRFRENETLQQLNAHRQSGGERAVSTIFYLMALQSMAQSPFRVVDEINQGMDPRNERMVHERMVEIACREHTSQYFLITPKLLTGLRYDAKMRILCIASGEFMPAEGRKLDLGRCLEVQKRLMAAT